MPADFIYSTRQGEDVYHVFFMCPEAQKIEQKHKKYGKPPAAEKRRLCKVCNADARSVLGL